MDRELSHIKTSKKKIVNRKLHSNENKNKNNPFGLRVIVFLLYKNMFFSSPFFLHFISFFINPFFLVIILLYLNTKIIIQKNKQLNKKKMIITTTQLRRKFKKIFFLPQTGLGTLHNMLVRCCQIFFQKMFFIFSDI